EIDMEKTSALVIEALKSIGEENANDDVLKMITDKLSDTQLKQLRKDVALSRNWIRDLVVIMEENIEC
ncbi:MAG: hypothetical protein WBO96_06075, partial [Enterococcus aquimarinus]